MSVHTGWRSPPSPAAARRSSPRSTASATATAPATVKLAVAFTSTPRKVASSIAARPSAVTGSFTWMLGARDRRRRAWATIASGSRDSPGSTWAERRPCLPPVRSKSGSRSAAPRTATSSTIRQAISASPHVGFRSYSSRARMRHAARSDRTIPRVIGGFDVAPVAPLSRAYRRSSGPLESFQNSVPVRSTASSRRLDPTLAPSSSDQTVSVPRAGRRRGCEVVPDPSP